MSLLLVEVQGAEREIALLEDNRLVDYHRSADAGSIRPEEIYIGRVSRVMKILQAAFVRLADKVDGFLPFAQIPAGNIPQPGDSLLVQVKKPPLPGKAAYLTMDISLTGTLAILTPCRPGSRVSRRVGGEEDRRRLLRLARQLVPQDMSLVLREDSLHAGEDALRTEVAQLLARWQDIGERAAHLSPPAVVEQAPDALQRLLRDLHEVPERVLTNDPAALGDIGLPVTQAAHPMQLHEVHHKLQRALRRKVQLKSGASLVIDPCEAMTVIDVNTAQNIEGKNRDRALLKTNLEAAGEIARLLRLRRMGGIILIDFIDMVSSQDREEVLAALRDALSRDPVKTVVHGFTQLGLVEMTRKKADEPLASERLIPCPRCRGTGFAQRPSEDTQPPHQEEPDDAP